MEGQNMKKKHLRSIGVFLLLLSVSACSTKSSLEKQFLGKQFNYCQLQNYKLTNSGHHLWKHKHLHIDYDYSIDHEANTITFDGTVKFNPDYIKEQTMLYSLFSSRCEFRVLFADKAGKVVAVELFYMLLGADIYESVPFKETLPYDDSYCHVIFFYYLHTTSA
jgi:hypothetical protein